MTDRPRTSAAAWLGQWLLYGGFAAFIGLFSHWPSYQHLATGQALIKVSFTHAGQPAGDCVRLSEAELARLPPNMRAPVKCPRERSPVVIEVDINGANALRRVAQPSGLSKDGASAVYQRLPVAAGEQRIQVRLNDDARQAGFTHQREAVLSLAPNQVLVIDFNAEQGGITLR